MKTNRFWIETVALGTAIACALALLIAILAAGTVAVAERGDSGPKEYQGMVTCSRCGAKHSADLGRTASDCTLICVHGGATFALVDGDKTYQLEGDGNLMKRVAGQRARIRGVARGNTIKVSSVAASS